MPFLSVVKIELVKLYHKRTTLLLLLLFLVPALFGIGMAAGLSFFVSDGSDGGVVAVANGLSGMGFTVDMLGQSKYILFLVVIILAAISFSSELENGQMKSAVTRICSRVKILTAKYMALLIVVSLTLLLFVFWSLLLYMALVIRTSYASGQIFDRQLSSQIGYLLFQWLAAAVMIGVTFLMGVKLKTFPCFAISYIIWFASLYSDFMENIKLLFPNNMPDFVLKNAADIQFALSYAAVYTGYCFVLLLLTAALFRRMDIKK
jgi:ABC-type transport system involved in multi-copper enzyme maturation permease subunit